MTKVKICGLRRPEDMEAVNEIRPDFAGFVFAPSRRQIDKEQAAYLKALLHPQIPTVGVFVQAACRDMAALYEEGIIDLIQLHGGETEEQVREVKRLTGAPVILAVSVNGPEDVLCHLDSSADYLLFDHGKGGTGKPFCWDHLPPISRPYFLAGGLSLGNLPQALALHPWGLDVSSGVESDGKKDKEKMMAFVQQVRKFDRKEES